MANGKLKEVNYQRRPKSTLLPKFVDGSPSSMTSKNSKILIFSDVLNYPVEDCTAVL